MRGGTPLRRPPSVRELLPFAGLALGPVAAAAGLALGFDPVAHESEQPLIHREDGFDGAAACAACHPDQHASWARTYHRTMTQRVSEATVAGAFDGRPVSYEGRTVRPFRRDGRFWFELPGEPGGVREAEVALAVGSRRYQQYFERVEKDRGFTFVRLPFLWNIEAGRWQHLNTVFLGPDGSDWNQHRTRWNDNCIFCHNTGPRPGELPAAAAVSSGQRQYARGFDSHVAQLGIACEACHGPGAAHVERSRDPLRRYIDYARSPGDTPRADIVNPAKLDKERAVSVCGQCHGQRLPLDLGQLGAWLTTGPTFRSGNRLTDHERPIEAGTASIDDDRPDLFSLRFWGDGTPRLTAYEYQGVTASACYRRGSMTCGSCHEMHGGDPKGMIEPDKRGDAACTPCHASIARDVRAHTKHDPARSGSRCLECHMPRAVYGLLTVHRSHRIENPDPARDAAAGRPHACTSCHLDRSLAWSAERMSEWWGGRYSVPDARRDGAPVTTPDSLASLLAGDPVQRAVYAHAAGRADSPLAPREKAFLRAALAATLADAWPSVRALARESLLALDRELPLGFEPELAAWDQTDGADRERFARRLMSELPQRAPGRLDPPEPGQLLEPDFSADVPGLVSLLRLQEGRAISIGE